jgi:hypothetical protein
MGDTKKTSGSRNNRYRLQAVRLVRGEEGHFHPNDVKFALLAISANAFKSRAGRHVIVICESSRCSTRASHFLLPEKPSDFVAQGSH